MNLLSLILFLMSAHGAETLSLKGSTVQVSESPFWVDSWFIHQHKDISLLAATNFSSSMLLTFSGSDFTDLNQKKATSLKTQGDAIEWVYSDERVRVERRTTPGDDFVTVDLKVRFLKNAPEKAYLSIVSKNVSDDKETRDRQLAYYTDQKIERRLLSDYELSEPKAEDIPGPIKWVGAQSHYFGLFVLPAQSPTRLLGQATGEHQGQMSLEYPVQDGALNLSFRVAFVPKELEKLRALDPTLDTSVDLGWFTFVAYPLLWLLKFLYKFVGNYGVAIVILTIIVKILLFPLVVKGIKGMRKMAEIQPKLNALKEKHKGNKEAYNREMMAFMQKNKYNPLSGCLPLLVQMPVFFALYSVLYTAVELYRAPFFLWLNDLSAHDRFYITPVVLAGLMFLQQKLTPPTAAMDPTQQKVMQFLPIVFGAFMITTPSGLCVYMIVNTIFSIGQQYYLNKKYGLTGAASAVTSI
jgi:YidC/Oxa1 family membrane protein insertase